MERERIQGLPKFLSTPIISGTGKATNFKFCTHNRTFLVSIHYQFLEKYSRVRSEDSQNFSGHP